MNHLQHFTPLTPHSPLTHGYVYCSKNVLSDVTYGVSGESILSGVIMVQSGVNLVQLQEKNGLLDGNGISHRKSYNHGMGKY